jgi:hypothetical protein
VLAFLSRGKTVIAVQDNTTAMQVTGTALLHSDKHTGRVSGGERDSARGAVSSGEASVTRKGSIGRVLQARSYAEAAGLIAAMKAGILLDAISPCVPPIPVTSL